MQIRSLRYRKNLTYKLACSSKAKNRPIGL
nr:MAG TPA: hypothetical protein [Caudoviricetes sp.]